VILYLLQYLYSVIGGESCILHKPPILIVRLATPTTDGWPFVQNRIFVALNFLEARFWTASGLPTIRSESRPSIPA
jgi:hypothetical protein